MSPERGRTYDLFISKLNGFSKVEELADEFSRAYSNKIEEMNVFFTDIILKCCRIPDLPPVDHIKNSKFDDIDVFLEEFIENPIINVQAFTTYDQCFEKYWCNLLSFFECVISLNWKYLTGNCEFNSYLVKLLGLFGEVPVHSLRHFSVMIRFKFVNALVKNNDVFTNHVRSISQFAIDGVLRYAYYDVNTTIWIYSLHELDKWLLRSVEFLKIEFFNYVIWSIRDEVSRVTQLGLEISSKLLSNRESRAHLTGFVRKLVETYTFVVKTTNNRTFEMVCECSCLIREHFTDEQASVAEILQVIRDNVFAANSARAKTAAKFLVRLEFDETSSVETLRKLIAPSLCKTGIYVEMWADAFVHVFDVFTDWNFLASILFDKVEPERRFTIVEKETLLCVIVYVITQLVTGRRPKLRTSTTSSKDATTIECLKSSRCKRISKEITAAFGNVLKDASSLLDGSNGPHSRLLYMKLITFFDFDSMPLESIVSLCASCILTFRMPNISYLSMKVSMEILLNIVHRSTKQAIREFLREKAPIYCLKSYLQTQFATKMKDLIENPHVYAENTDRQQSVVDAAFGLHVLSLSVPLDQLYALDTPLQLLEYKLFPWNPAFLAAREVSIMVSGAYVECQLDDLLEKSKGNETRTATIRGERECIANVRKLLHLYSLNLNVYFHGRSGEMIFYKLCGILNKLSQLSIANSVFPDELKQKMVAYVALTVCGLGEGTTVNVSQFCSEKNSILRFYLPLIESNVLSMDYAYDILDAYCKNCDDLLEPLQQFLVTVCERRAPRDIARWLIVLPIFRFEAVRNKTDFLCVIALARRLAQLICSIKKKLDHVARLIHTVGIDYATTVVNDSSQTPIKFLYLLAEFSVCLSAANKLSIYKYFSKKKATDAEVMRHYVDSLRKPYKETLATTVLDNVTDLENDVEFESRDAATPEKLSDSNQDLQYNIDHVNLVNEETISQSSDVRLPPFSYVERIDPSLPNSRLSPISNCTGASADDGGIPDWRDISDEDSFASEDSLTTKNRFKNEI